MIISTALRLSCINVKIWEGSKLNPNWKIILKSGDLKRLKKKTFALQMKFLFIMGLNYFKIIHQNEPDEYFPLDWSLICVFELQMNDISNVDEIQGYVHVGMSC